MKKESQTIVIHNPELIDKLLENPEIEIKLSRSSLNKLFSKFMNHIGAILCKKITQDLFRGMNLPYVVHFKNGKLELAGVISNTNVCHWEDRCGKEQDLNEIVNTILNKQIAIYTSTTLPSLVAKAFGEQIQEKIGDNFDDYVSDYIAYQVRLKIFNILKALNKIGPKELAFEKESWIVELIDQGYSPEKIKRALLADMNTETEEK